MKKSVLVLAVALLSLAIPFSVLAAEEVPDNSFVIRGGFASPSDMEMAPSGEPGSTASFDTGYSVGVALGRRISTWFRGEVEIGWISMDADTLFHKKRGVVQEHNGTDEHLYAMLNGIIDYQNDSGFTPYIGIGIGVTRADLKSSFIWPYNGERVTRESSCTALAYQAMLGVNWSIDHNLGLDLRGRYFGSDERTHDNHSGGFYPELEVDGSSIWTVELGISYSF